MADLTTTDGSTVHFDPGAVTAVADHDADTGDAVTTVYGLSAGLYRIGEAVDGFLTRIGVAASFVRLTRLDGTFIWANVKAVQTVRTPLVDEYGPQAQAVVAIGSLTQAVTQTPDEVKQIVNAQGGKL